MGIKYALIKYNPRGEPKTDFLSLVSLISYLQNNGWVLVTDETRLLVNDGWTDDANAIGYVIDHDHSRELEQSEIAATYDC